MNDLKHNQIKKDNPDLSTKFIEDILIGIKQIDQHQVENYIFEERKKI